MLHDGFRELQSIVSVPQTTDTRSSSSKSFKNFVRKRFSKDGNRSSMNLFTRMCKPKTDEDGPDAQTEKISNSLLSDRAREEGGYDSDAASLPDVDVGEGIVDQLSRISEEILRVSPVKRRNSTDRTDVQDIEWVGYQPIIEEDTDSIGQAITDNAPVLPKPSFKDLANFQLYNPSMPNLLGTTFSDEDSPDETKQPALFRSGTLRRSRSDSSITAASPHHTKLPSTSSSTERRIMRLSIQGGSMHSSHFPLPPKNNRRSKTSSSTDDANMASEVIGDKLDIKEWPLRSASETLSTSPQSPERKPLLRKPAEAVSSESGSIHLYSMRISQHLRSHDSSMTSLATTVPPTTTAGRRRQMSSSGFASTKVPTTWGAVVGEGERKDQASSNYSTRANSLNSMDGLPRLGLSGPGPRSGYEVLDLYDVAAVAVPPLAELHGDNEFRRDAVEAPEPQSPEAAPDATTLKLTRHKTEMTDTQSFDSSSQDARSLTRSNARRFASFPLPLIKRSKELILSPHRSGGEHALAVDGGADDSLFIKPGRIRRAMQLGGSHAHDEANQVWERALQAHRDEKASLFLSPEQGGTADRASSLFRERSKSVYRRRGSQFDTEESELGHDHAVPRQQKHHEHQMLDPWSSTETSGQARRRKALAELLGEDVPPDHIGPEIVFEAPSSVSSEPVIEIDDSTLGAWSRYPSHSRDCRTGSAGESDRIITRDFAYEMRLTDLDSGDEETDGNAKAKKKSVKTGMTKNRSLTLGKRFFKEYFKMFRPQSHDFLRHGHGHRTSVAEGGTLEAPELELLPPVFAAFHPTVSSVQEEAIELAESPSKNHDSSTQVDGECGFDAEPQQAQKNGGSRSKRQTDSSHASSEWKVNARLYSTLLLPEEPQSRSASARGTELPRRQRKSQSQWEEDALLWTGQLGEEPTKEQLQPLMPGVGKRQVSGEVRTASQVRSSEDWKSDARLFSQLYESCVELPAAAATGHKSDGSGNSGSEEISALEGEGMEPGVSEVLVKTLPAVELEGEGKQAMTESIIESIRVDEL
ncbi:hypothetical protein K490DRAFT_67208 [Saccharata proteae CBS 121410]|uniref:Uncharacterized protein n=1 Tax=Saccharata proteae CBS 121410 TaxID=1314787 RepID=A0A9P4LXB3_9PEZI|nr:hypothetical protein K490DRAFT_67208 [Saccharata proteae CBS 121410]